MKVQCGKITRGQKWPSLDDFKRINVCSSAKGIWTQLSPMVLGPVEMFSVSAKVFENLWQFSKVYLDEVDEKGDPTELFFSRQEAGNAKEKGKRRKQKGKPLYSWWDGRKMSYLEARHEIYVPGYVKLVCKTEAWKQLKKLRKTNNILIVGYDGREYTDLLEEYWNEKKPFGHELVLCAILEGKLDSSGKWVYPRPPIEKLPRQLPEYYYGEMFTFMPDEEVRQNLVHGLAKYAIERCPNKPKEIIEKKLRKRLRIWLEKDRAGADYFADQAEVLFEAIIERAVARADAFLS